MMAVRETLSVAIDALRANKLRAMLTSLGVIIGSASIVLVVTVALTSQKFVIGQIEAVGSNLVWVELSRSSDKPQPLSYEMTLADMETAKTAIPGVAETAGIRDMPMEVVVKGAARPVNLIGVTEGYQKIRRLVVLSGRYFDSLDMQSRGKVCLVTKELADRVYGLENPVGRSLRMGELTFTVIGLFRERVSTYGQSEIQDESVIIPFSLMKYYTGVDVVRTLYAQAARPDDVSSVQRQLAQFQPERFGVHRRTPAMCLSADFHPSRTAGIRKGPTLPRPLSGRVPRLWPNRRTVPALRRQ